MKTVPFVKMNGLGNDFVIIDAITNDIQPDTEFIRGIADRRLGVGCDQVLWLSGHENDVLYRVFNADGTEVSQCGNGARCIGHYMSVVHSYNDWPLKLHTSAAGVLKVDRLSDASYSVNMGLPKAISGDIKDLHSVSVDGLELLFWAVDIGNPHAIFNCSGLDLDILGQLMQNHAMFPFGVNVSDVCFKGKSGLDLVVFERGVGRTEACGSAAVAAVVAGVCSENLAPGLSEVNMPGGTLQVDFDYKHCVQSGLVDWVFVGSWQTSKQKDEVFHFDCY